MATGVEKRNFNKLSNSPDPKIGDRCKQHAIIFYGDQVIPLWSLHRP